MGNGNGWGVLGLARGKCGTRGEYTYYKENGVLKRDEVLRGK